jgi:hypothetical protein
LWGAMLVLALLGFLNGCSDSGTTSSATAIAANHSTPTLCAEEDNVNIPLLGDVQSFVVEATHPTYDIGQDNCDPDFTNCPPPEPGYPFLPRVYSLFDDGETVVEAVRERSWWQPGGMTAGVDDSCGPADIHYVRVYRKIASANEWPQFFVLYADGNMRLIPHPPVGRDSVCFGSSVIIGPAAVGARPIAEIDSARYVSASKTMEVTYRTGGSARLDLADVTRTRAHVTVTVDYPTEAAPFATFRSMFVAEDNADVGHVRWRDPGDTTHEAGVMQFAGGEGTEWFFHRQIRSRHNTSAPDICIRLVG